MLGPTYTTNVDLSVVDGELVVNSTSGSSVSNTATSFINNPLASVTSVSFLSGPKGDKGDTGNPGTTDYNALSNKPTIPTTTSQLTNDSGYLTSYTETDPVFTASAAHNITSTDITNLGNLSGINSGDQTSVSGNAGTATKLQTARNINGVAFDGTGNITVADSTKVPTTTTVNGHALSSNVTVSANDVLPTQTGNSGKYLSTDGTNSSWQTVAGGGSGIVRSVNVISANTTAGATTTTDYVYLVSGTTTLTLPTAVSNTNLYTVTNTGSNTVSVATTGGQTINGSTTATLIPNVSLDFVSTNSNWRVV